MNEEHDNELEEIVLEYEEEGVCIECHSSQPDQYMMRQIEKGYQGPGDWSVPCKYCGGVAKIVAKTYRENFLAMEDRRRGIYTPTKDDD